MRETTPHTIKFIEAVKANDREALDAFSKDIIPRLKEYLKITVVANEHMAGECAHQAFAVVLDRVIKLNIDEGVNIIGYMLISARNEYFTMLRKESREGSAVFKEQLISEPEEQIELLVEHEREKIMQKCIEELDSKSRELIQYMFKHPDASFLKMSKVFKISPQNVRTRKSRSIRALAQCFKRKSES